MIVAAACLAKETKSGQPVRCPFGRGRNHGEAHTELTQVYGVFDNVCPGFIAYVDGKIVFLDREDAMKHALECGQVKPDKRKCKRLNSEIVAFYEKGHAESLLNDTYYRIRDFYFLAKSMWSIDHDYKELASLSDDERRTIFQNVVDACKLEGIRPINFDVIG